MADFEEETASKKLGDFIGRNKKCFIAVLVVWDLFAVIATFSPAKLLISVDFPTFVLPIIDTKPDLKFAII